MSDKPRAPGPPHSAPTAHPVPTGRAPAGGPPVLLPGTEYPTVRVAPSSPTAPIAVQAPPLALAASAVQAASRTSSGRPADVQQTSTTSIGPVATGLPDGEALIKAPQAGRPLDVQPVSSKQAVLAEHKQHVPRPQRKPKPRTELDERGRYRHTLRLTPQSEQKLREIAESMGVDLNAAISVCIATCHQALAKRGKVDS